MFLGLVKGSYTYWSLHGMGPGKVRVLKFFKCFQVLLFLNIYCSNKRSVFYFWRWDGKDGVVAKFVIFCGLYKFMTPNALLGCSCVFQNGRVNSQAAILMRTLVGRDSRLIFLYCFPVTILYSSWVWVSESSLL